MRGWASIIFLFVFVTIAIPQTKLKKVTFIPHWLPQAQFAGYYAAYEMGIYKKHSIDLEILTGGPDKPSSEVMKTGKADFGLLLLTNAIQLREEGIKIVNIAQMVQKSALMLIAKKSSGIKEPKDMDGKKVGLWGGYFQIQPMAFFRKYAINVKPVPQGSSINLFLMDGVQVTTAMWYDEYHRILNSGYTPDELKTFFFSDYGLNFPEEGIYVSENFYNENPKICEEFIKASVEGWVWACNNPGKAVEIVIKYMKAAKLPVNIAHQNWMLARFKDLMFDKSNPALINTMLSKDDYSFVALSLKHNGNIKVVPYFREFCRFNNSR